MIRIDPSVRPLWRSPSSVQLGADPVVAVLDPVPDGGDRVLAALVAGTGPGALRRTAAAAGLDRAGLDAVLAAVAPALLTGRRARPRLVGVAIDGPEDLTDLLARLLLPGDAPVPVEDADLVLVAAHHLVPPAAAVRHLAEDRPHLPVVFGDQAVVIGPLVVPGATPCLRCAEEHRLDRPERRAVAAQLLRSRTSRTASSTRATLRAALLLGDALAALADGGPSGFEDCSVRLEPDGTVSRSAPRWHERCGCRSPAG